MIQMKPELAQRKGISQQLLFIVFSRPLDRRPF